MNPRILQYLQNALLTAVTVVLALVVLSAFLRIIRPPETATSAETDSSTATSLVAAGETFDQTATTATPSGETPTSLATGDEPICREPIPPGGGTTVLRVFYHCGSGSVPNPDTFVYREVPRTDLVLTNTLEQMVAGPEPSEAALGYQSMFSEDTSRTFASVTINSGTAIIDFTGLETMDNLSTATASEFFLANLNANVFQFDTISGVEYRLGGSCDAFYALLQRECIVVTGQSWNQQAAEWRDAG